MQQDKLKYAKKIQSGTNIDKDMTFLDILYLRPPWGYDKLQAASLTTPKAYMTIHLSDWNGHVDAAAGSFENLHGGRGYGNRNTE